MAASPTASRVAASASASMTASTSRTGGHGREGAARTRQAIGRRLGHRREPLRGADEPGLCEVLGDPRVVEADQHEQRIAGVERRAVGAADLVEDDVDAVALVVLARRVGARDVGGEHRLARDGGDDAAAGGAGDRGDRGGVAGVAHADDEGGRGVAGLPLRQRDRQRHGPAGELAGDPPGQRRIAAVEVADQGGRHTVLAGEGARDRVGGHAAAQVERGAEPDAGGAMLGDGPLELVRRDQTIRKKELPEAHRSPRITGPPGAPARREGPHTRTNPSRDATVVAATTSR
jgi:hypothetical protein